MYVVSEKVITRNELKLLNFSAEWGIEHTDQWETTRCMNQNLRGLLIMVLDIDL